MLRLIAANVMTVCLMFLALSAVVVSMRPGIPLVAIIWCIAVVTWVAADTVADRRRGIR